MKFNIALISIILFLGGCATYSPTLTNQERKKLNNITLYHDIASDEIRVQPVLSNAGTGVMVGVGGFLGALVGGAINAGVNSERVQEAEEKSIPFRTMLTGYEFRPVMTTALVNAVLTSGEITLSEPQDIPPGASGKELLELSNADAIIVTKSGYMLSPDSTMLEVKLDYTVFFKQVETKTSKTRRITSKAAIFQSLNKNWDRELLEKQIFLGVNEVAKLLIMDLKDPRTPKEMKEHEVSLETLIYGGSDTKTEAYKLGESVDGTYMYYRLKNGNLISIPANQALRLQYKIT